MRIKSYLKKLLKYILIGRWVQIVDKAIFKFSNKKSSGWVIGNKIRNWFYGKSEYVSDLPIIFIGCFPRSGSTLLRSLLEQHPEIRAGQREINMFQDIKTKWKIKEALDFSDRDLERLEKYEKDLSLYAEKLLNKYKEKEEAKYVLLKQPKHVFFIKKIFKYFPNARFIHIIRDGRGATMSQRYYMLPSGKKGWPYEWCCRQWATAINNGKEWRKDDRYREVKFEDILKKPHETISELFKFMNLEPISKEKLFKAHKNFNKGKRPDHKEVANPIDDSKINKWLPKMSQEDKQKFKRIAGDELVGLGYEDDNDW